MLTKVTSTDFQGLINPYTGEPMTVFMVVSPKGVKFTCPDTFSTADPAESPSELYRGWDRVNGVAGVKKGKKITCAYTGETLTIATRFGKPCYSGGFDPHRFYTRDEFIYYAKMRDGVSPVPPPSGVEQRVKAPPRSSEITERQQKHVDSMTPSLDDEKIHMIETSMSKMKDDLEKSSTVSMADTRRHGRGK